MVMFQYYTDKSIGQPTHDKLQLQELLQHPLLNPLALIWNWCPPLQPQQFPLFWEGLLQDFGMCLLEFFPIHPEEHEVRAFCGSVKFFHTKRIQPMPLWTTLCELVHSHAETERAFLKLFPQSWKHGIVQSELKDLDFPSFPSWISLHSAARQVIFLLHLLNSDLSIILCKQRSVFDHSTEDIFTAPESSGGSSQCPALCLACMQLLAHGKPYHEAPGPKFFPNVNARGGLEVYNYF